MEGVKEYLELLRDLIDANLRMGYIVRELYKKHKSCAEAIVNPQGVSMALERVIMDAKDDVAGKLSKITILFYRNVGKHKNALFGDDEQFDKAVNEMITLRELIEKELEGLGGVSYVR